MLIHAPITPPPLVCFKTSNTATTTTVASVTASSSKYNKISSCLSLSSRTRATGLLAAAVVVIAATTGGVGLAIEAPDDAETLSNVPQELSGECKLAKDCKKPRIQRPKSRKAESCTIKCVTTCIRGGDGSPGEGPLNVKRPIVVFKEGFRSRRYWDSVWYSLYRCKTKSYSLVECSEICNLIGDEEDGPQF